MAPNRASFQGDSPDPADSGAPDDSQQWADLAKELETPDPLLDAEDPEPVPGDAPDRRAKPETSVPDVPLDDPEAPDGAKPDPNKPKPTYEQLESNQRNVTEALRRERETRRKAEESLTNVNRLIEELRAARQPPKAPEKEPPPLPDVTEDPIGHFQAKVAQLEQALMQTHQGSRQTAEQIAAREQEQVFWNHVQASEDEFRKTTPVVEVNGKQVNDYDAACEHLKMHRMAELANLYPDTSSIAMAEAQQYGLPSPAHLRAAILQQDAIGIAQRAFQLGVPPAQLYYEAAKGRGYQRPLSNGKRPASGKIEAHRRGEKAALTISGGEGRKTANDMTISDLSELFIDDPEEFDKQWDKMARAGKLG